MAVILLKWGEEHDFSGTAFSFEGRPHLRAARRMGFGQIELGVFSRNGRAKRLYEKMGFVRCGTTPRAVRYKDGSYDDEIVMVKRLETT